MLSLLVHSITAGPPVQSVIQVKVPVSVRFNLHNHDVDGHRPTAVQKTVEVETPILNSLPLRRTVWKVLKALKKNMLSALFSLLTSLVGVEHAATGR